MNNNDSSDSSPSPLFDAASIIDDNPALNPPALPSTPPALPSENGSTRAQSAPERSEPAKPIAWTRDELKKLPEYLRRPIYLRLKQEILGKRLDGHVLNDQPLRIKVPIPDNGTRARTFRQVVLQPSAEVESDVNRLYAEVWSEVTAATHGRHLTLKQALNPDLQPPRFSMRTSKLRRESSAAGPEHSD